MNDLKVGDEMNIIDKLLFLLCYCFGIVVPIHFLVGKENELLVFSIISFWPVLGYGAFTSELDWFAKRGWTFWLLGPLVWFCAVCGWRTYDRKDRFSESEWRIRYLMTGGNFYSPHRFEEMKRLRELAEMCKNKVFTNNDEYPY